MQVGEGDAEIDGVVFGGGLEGVGLKDGILPLVILASDEVLRISHFVAWETYDGENPEEEVRTGIV